MNQSVENSVLAKNHLWSYTDITIDDLSRADCFLLIDSLVNVRFKEELNIIEDIAETDHINLDVDSH